VHFSAFFGDWGDARPYRETFGGYFHRLKMLGSSTDHSWLFVCDSYGAHHNGTYYLGEKGDLYVERAMDRLIRATQHELGVPDERTVTVGSSMGATAAIKFALLLGLRGAAAVVPHIDLDICAVRQNRWDEVAFTCPDGDPTAVENFPITRRIRQLVEDHQPPLPHLFLQSCADDAGVHDEQVLPLAGAWGEKGKVELDARPTGGHTSAWATRPLLLDAVTRILEGVDIDPRRYQTDPTFAGALVRPPLSHRVRRTLSLLRKRLLGRR
jgi:hypothetical protein